MEGFACSPYVCRKGRDLKPLWITHPSTYTRPGEKKDRQERRGRVSGEVAVSSQKLEDIHTVPPMLTHCLNQVGCSSFNHLLLWINLVKIRHSCCNPRALILPQLYFPEEADRKLLAFL